MIRQFPTIALVLLGWSLAATADEPALVGTLVDEAGRPVAGGLVVALIRGKKTEGVSDAAGAFRISIASGGRIWGSIRARSTDGRLGSVSLQQAEGKNEPVKIVLKPAREIAVTVVDREGKPVEGAGVDFMNGMFPDLDGRTDAQGRWLGRVPADATNWAVIARKGGVGFDYASGERPRGSKDKPYPLPAEIKLTLDGARPLRVKVVDREGRPLTGANVGPWLIQKPGRESEMNLGGMLRRMPVTDRDGLVTIDWMPDPGEETRSILVDLDLYYDPNNTTWLSPDKPVDEVTITLYPTERLGGRVTFADGRPASGALVAIEGHGGGEDYFRDSARTDAAGRFEIRAHAEQAYILAASLGEFASPYRSDVVLRASKPVLDVDLVLAKATKVRGRVTVGKEDRPVPASYVGWTIEKGPVPPELVVAGSRFPGSLSMSSSVTTDDSGRFEFLLGPGDYQVAGPGRVEPVKVVIPAANPPSELVVDLKMPRPETGPFAGTVVDAEGKPVAGAIVDGMYASFLARRWFDRIKADDKGTFRTERSLEPLVIHATSPDGKLGAIFRSDAEATEARIVLGPTAMATGRLLDDGGKVIPNRKLIYGIRVPMGEEPNSPWTTTFGGNAQTDADGQFTLANLVPGEEYDLNLPTDEAGSSKGVTKVTANGPGPFSIGDAEVNTQPYKPYVPPTVQQRTAQAFEARKSTPPKERLESTLAEAKREYTRPMLLFGKPDDPACIELFRLFNEDAPEEDPAKPRAKTPSELRWEFELTSFDTTQPEIRKFPAGIKTDSGEGRPPYLVVLDPDGSISAQYDLKLNQDGKLDGPELGRFLAEHKLATRDAGKMLADALIKAKAEDKRVFFIASASWCGPCRMLARFLAPRKAELERHFVFVKLDVSRDLHGQEVRDRFKQSASGGVPWYAILDEAGNPTVTSNLPVKRSKDGSTNIGFPSSRPSVDHFVEMLRQTAPRMSAEALDEVKNALLKK